MHLPPFNIIGISTRTTNQNGQAAADIGQLYDKFYANNILSRIPHRLDDDLCEKFGRMLTGFSREM